MADGKIVFDATLSTKQLESELKRVRMKMLRLQEDSAMKRSERTGLEANLEAVNKQLDEARAKYAEIQSQSMGSRASTNLLEQYDVVQGLEGRAHEIEASIESINQKIAENTQNLETQRGIENEISGEIGRRSENEHKAGEEAENTANNVSKIAKDSNESSNAVEKLTKRIIGLAKRVFIFSLITSAMRKLREYVGSIVMQNEKASQSVAQLRGALATLVQPIINAIIPAFTALINIITRVVVSLASLVSSIFGTTAKASANAAKALNNQAKGYGGVAKSAKEAKRELMGFDEINKLSDDDSDSGGGGGGSASTLDFSAIDDIQPKLSDALIGIMAIGAAISLLAGSWIPLLIGGLVTVGIWLVTTFGDAEQFTAGMRRAWEGIKKVFIGIIELDPQKTVNGIKEALDGIQDAFTSIDWESAGKQIGEFITKIDWEELANTVLTFVKETIKGIWDGVVSALEVIFADAIQTSIDNGGNIAEGIFIGMLQAIGNVATWILDNIVNPLCNAFCELLGIHSPSTVFAEYGGYIIEGLLEGLKSSWESVKTWFETSIRPIFTTDFWTNVFTSIGEGLKNGVNSAVNWVIDKINAMIDSINSALSFSVGGGTFFGHEIPVYEMGVTIPNIPHLANGAVIPANKPFLAELGDQTSGTNIEAPLDTIKQAVAEVMDNGQLVQLLTELISVTQSVADRPITMDGMKVSNIVSSRQNEMSRMWG